MNQVDPTGGFSGKNPIKTIDNAPSISVGEDCYCTRVDYVNELVWTAAAEGTYFSDSEDYIYGTLQSFDGFFGPELSPWEQFAVRLPTAGNIQKGGVVMYNSGVSGGGFGGQAENVTVVEDFSSTAAGPGGGNFMQRVGQIISSSNALGDGLKNIKDYFGWGNPDIVPAPKEVVLVRTEIIHKGTKKYYNLNMDNITIFKVDTLRDLYSDSTSHKYTDNIYNWESGF